MENEKITSDFSEINEINPQKPSYPISKVTLSLFLGLTGAAILATLKLQRKISLQAAVIGGATCTAVALIGSSTLSGTPRAPSYLSREEILEKVRSNQTGESLDLSNLDPTVDAKELFIAIVTQLPEESTLETITNCRPFTLSDADFDKKKDAINAGLLFPKDPQIKARINEEIPLNCSANWQSIPKKFFNSLNNKNVTFAHLILENPNNEFLEIIKNITVIRLSFTCGYKIIDGAKALEAIKAMNPDEISLELDAPKKGEGFINWNQLNSTYDVFFKITTEKTEENKANWETAEQKLNLLKNKFSQGTLDCKLLYDIRSLTSFGLDDIDYQAVLKKK